MSASVGVGRTTQEIVRYMAQEAAGDGQAVTDVNPLSVFRTLMESFAVEGERLEENFVVGLAEGVERSTYRSFDFPVLAATRASGVLRVTRTVTAAALTVPAGTRALVPNSTKVYQTLDAIVLGIGVATGTGRIQAIDPGLFANTPASTVTQLVSGQGALVVTNEAAVGGGADEENDEQRKLRFKDYVAAIHRGTPDAVATGARSAALYDGGGNVTERVRSAQVTDGYAIATCYVYNGDPATVASSDLLARAQQIIDGYTDGMTGALVAGYKAAGVAIAVRAATVRPQAVSAILYLATGWTFNMVQAGVEAAIRAVFAQLAVGSALLRLNDLRQAIGSVPGVIDHGFVIPVADVAGGDGIIIALSSLALAQG